MSYDIPKNLRMFAGYVDGVGYGGQIIDGTPPKIVMQTEEFQAGGMVAPEDLSLNSVEKMVCDMSVKEVTDALYNNLNKPNLPFTLRGSKGSGPDAEPVIFQMRGLMRELDPGQWKAGGDAALKVAFTCRYLKVTIGTNEVAEISTWPPILKIGGIDYIAQDRKNLGL